MTTSGDQSTTRAAASVQLSGRSGPECGVADVRGVADMICDLGLLAIFAPRDVCFAYCSGRAGCRCLPALLLLLRPAICRSVTL